jgi:hypothetical protein
VLSSKRLQKHPPHKLERDIVFVGLSIVAALFILYSGILESFLALTDQIHFLGSFIAGLFFTSAFTIAPASVAIAKLAATVPPFTLAFFAALGAMVGDLLIFLFIRDSLVDDIKALIDIPEYRKIRHVFRMRIFRWVVPLVGALIIVSPLPDEIGLAMMGFSRVKTSVMMPITFVLNFIAVLLIIGLVNIF